MIAIEEINAAIKDAQPLFSELQNLYGCLPETLCCCEQPGVCCAFLPEMTLLEALRWIRVIQEMPPDARTRILSKFLEFYLTNPILRSACPFLEKGACSIYEWRPFACRAYGLWSPEFGKRRTEKSRGDRKTLLQMWQKFGLVLPPETVQFEIDYCGKVDCTTDNDRSDEQLMAILQEIYQLDARQAELRMKFENDYHSDFSLLLAALSLGYKKAVLGKFAVIKEIVQQRSEERLRQMLGKVTPNSVLNP
jgi:Fe-S-cluster containining protein